MAIATAGIIDQEWADLLKSWIAGDRYVDYYIETRNLGSNLPVDSDDIAKIRNEYSYIDSITGLRFRETSEEAAADILIAQVDRSFFAAEADGDTLGVTSVENDGTRDRFLVLYYDQTYDNAVIRHEIGHTLGLDHPYRDGFNPLYNNDDTMMSYNNNSANTVNITDSDKSALKYLWGEAGTNYDYVAPVQTTPQPPTTPNSTLVASLVSGAWLQPSEVSTDSNVTYYIDRKGKFRFSKSFGRKVYSAGTAPKETAFIRDFFSQVDSAIPWTVSEVGSASQADIVIGCFLGNKRFTGQSLTTNDGQIQAAWRDQRYQKLTEAEKSYIGYAITTSFGLGPAVTSSTVDTVLGSNSVGYYGLTVNDRAALGQLWAT